MKCNFEKKPVKPSGVLSNISKELRFKILQNEMSWDPMFQASMDDTYHHSILYSKEYFFRNFKQKKD